MEWSEWKENEALGKDDSNEEEEEIAVVKGKIVKLKKGGKGIKINNTEALKGKFESIRLDPEVSLFLSVFLFCFCFCFFFLFLHKRLVGSRLLL